jgi:hypothetical protein
MMKTPPIEVFPRNIRTAVSKSRSFLGKGGAQAGEKTRIVLSVELSH